MSRRSATAEREAEQRAALHEAVHPPARCCAKCGGPCATPPSVNVADARGDGSSADWSVCPTCATTPRPLAVLAVLGVPVTEEAERAAASVPLPRWAERWGSHPDSPQVTPWAHVDRTEMGRQYAQGLARIRAATLSPPCGLCGSNYDEDGGTLDKHGAMLCSRCAERRGQATAGASLVDLAAAVLSGLATDARTPLVPGLALLCGLTDYATAYNRGGIARKGTPEPWAWTDRAAIRGAVAEAIASRRLRGPQYPEGSAAW